MPELGVQDLVVHIQKYTTLRQKCIMCVESRCHYFCDRCGLKFMCLNKGCFEQYHVHCLNQAAHGHI